MSANHHWSGLAPAVDAHLHRWSQADRLKPLAARAIAAVEDSTYRDAEKVVDGVLAHPLGSQWLNFGMSYGVPDEQGNPTVATYAIDTERREVVGMVDGATMVGREQWQGGDLQIVQGLALMLREVAMLHRAESVYVSADVVREVTEAAELMDPEPLRETDMFHPHGFAVLERPLLVPDLDPESGLGSDLHVYIRAVGWSVHDGIVHPADGKVRRGVTLFLYSTGQDTRDGYIREYLESGRDPSQVDMKGVGPHEFLPVDVVPWSFDVEWTTRDTPGYIARTLPGPPAYERRWFLALMRLMWQQTIRRHRPEVKRAESRRWARFKRPNLDYCVLRLRRIDNPWQAPTGTGVPLGHQVLVRGHWRNQYHPSLGPARLPDGSQDPMTHRLTWIEPHWRGPEDAPLGALHHATAVVR